jgi:hypothetical protein
MAISKLILDNNEYDLSGGSGGNTSFSVADSTLFIESSGYSNYSEPTLYEGRELDEFTWADLKQKCRNNDFSGLRVGDYKTITTFGYSNRMCIAGIDTYYGSGMDYHHIDWIGKNVAPVSGPWSSSRIDNNGNPYPYRYTYWSNSTFHDSGLPSEVINVLSSKEAPMERRCGRDGANSIITIDNSNGINIYWYNAANYLWLPTEYEVFGSTIAGTPKFSTTGVQYPIFRNNPSFRVKSTRDGGSAVKWWLATVAANSTTEVCAVDSHGILVTCQGPYISGSSYNTFNYHPICFTISGE